MTIKFRKDKRWKAFEQALDSRRFLAAAKSRVKRATHENAERAVVAVDSAVRRKRFAANAALTVFAKGSSVPLRAERGISASLEVKDTAWNKAWVGVPRGSPDFVAASAVHEGATLKVTDKVRAMFWALFLASQGRLDPAQLSGRARELWEAKPGGWFPLKDSTTQIVVPPRPFIEEAFSTRALVNWARRNWRLAVADTFRAVMP